MHPNLLIALCILLWGVWGFSSKLSNVHNAPVFVTLATNVLYALLSIPLLWKLKEDSTPINWSFSAIFWIVLTGVVGVSAKLVFNQALSKEPHPLSFPPPPFSPSSRSFWRSFF